MTASSDSEPTAHVGGGAIGGLVADLAAYRAALAGAPDAKRPATGVGHPFTSADEEAGGDGGVAATLLTLAEPRPVRALEAELGPARRLPRQGPGQPVSWLFSDTIPPEGASGVTVFAEADDPGDDGVIARLLLRRD